MSFTRAVVRLPSENFASGLSSAGEGAPNFERALEQHGLYVEALRSCGLTVTVLDADPAFPDATFVEDTAIVTKRGAILTRPGAPSRMGEVQKIGECLRDFYTDELQIIEPPGCVDGGDVCEAAGHFLIGLSARTNKEGAAQLADRLSRLGYTSNTLDIRDNPALLHLKSGIAYLGDRCWAVQENIRVDLQNRDVAEIHDLIVVSPAESYAANCVNINGTVFVAAGFERFSAELAARGLAVLPLDMSEFKKMDGGLSCLSLRF